ncbi:HutD family protein [Komagataeibacter intermedius]|uniref:HutD-family protein n=2 Tax=Komagataeibacter intermedius TaxID=66229 RepID=A0A0N0ME05_9PROT|nr:HutD family protein [Komagataeibacter intermedius]KPH85903.1 hypothetical protein GLUCOINTEAF2_0203117 [Komagataeibacter intermedius AF2]MCF3637371.1 HutD family protein [Komagataeibacter intermedius]GAN85560.1 hypothetical protein Gain_0004_006 [Komagataeibacter intermedius TF2]GBQ69764.1 hypothetical protein AA0521_1539 [Komagataeibacter intermedius NRIC 0521]
MKPDEENGNLFPAESRVEAIAGLTPQPWKNGRGITRVLTRNAIWRLSIAEIDCDGEFSRFPGMTRHIALLQGGGLTLCTPEGSAAHLGRPGTVHTFSGESQVSATLADGPVQVVNLMHVSSSAYRLEPTDRIHPPCDTLAFVAAHGRWEFQYPSGTKGVCLPGEFMMCNPRMRLALTTDGGDDALLYRVIPA